MTNYIDKTKITLGSYAIINPKVTKLISIDITNSQRLLLLKLVNKEFRRLTNSPNLISDKTLTNFENLQDQLTIKKVKK